MKCAYCKQTIPEIRDANEEPKERTYIVEINGVECEIWVHDKCLPKILSEYFSRPPVMYNTADAIPLNDLKIDDRPWTIMTPTWDCGGTLQVEKPSQTKVWCNTKETSSSAYNKEYNENPHIPWKNRVD